MPPLRFVLDEHLRRRLWRAIQRHNAQSSYPLDVVRVGDPPDLPLGTTDPDLLLWAEREGRIAMTLDRTTMPGHLALHLHSGHHSPGVFVIRPRSNMATIIAHLVLATYASFPGDWEDRIVHIPFP
jgi:hypothetical protein